MRTITVVAVCDVLPVRMQLEPAQSATTLEQLVLRAIAACEDAHERGKRVGVHDLADMFGVTPKLMLDLLGDLFRAQRITVEGEVSSEYITLTSTARDSVTGQLPESGSLRVTAEETVLLEPLTGSVLAFGAAVKFVRDRDLIVPRIFSETVRSEVTPDQIRRAINILLERDSGGRNRYAGLRVADAYLIPAVMSGMVGTRMLALTVAAGVDGAGRLVAAVTDQQLESDARQRGTQRLQRFIEDQPDHAFVIALRKRADTRAEPPESITGILDRMGAAARNLATAATGTRQARHGKLDAQAGEISSQLCDMAARQMTARILATAADHRTTVVALLEEPRTQQIVIAAPTITYVGLRPLLPVLSDAVRRGVHVFLMWGSGNDADAEQLPLEVRRALTDVERVANEPRAHGRLCYDRRLPSRINATFVLADDRCVLMTGMNLLAVAEREEFGVLAEARQGWRCPVAEELLRWVHRQLPNIGQAAELVLDGVEFGSGAAVSEPLLPPLPRWREALDDPRATAVDLRLWSQDWRDYSTALATISRDFDPVAYPVFDGTHRVLLWDGLRKAAHRLVVTSDQLSARVVTSDFVSRLEECLTRGVAVVLRYRRPFGEADRVAIEALTELSERFPPGPQGQGLTLLRDPRTHFKVLVVDDTVTIGSYNYLSKESQYPSGRTRQSEISLSFVSTGLSAQVFTALTGLPVPTAAAPTATVQPGAVCAARDVLAGLRAEPVDVDALAQSVRAAGADHAILGTLANSEAAPRDLLRVAAAVYSGTADGDSSIEWGRRLLDSLWREREWLAADIVRAALPTAARPSRALTEAAAGWNAGDATPIVDALLGDASGGDEGTALVVLAIVGYLDSAESILIESALHRVEELSPPVRDFAYAAADHVAKFGLAPVHELQAMERAAELRDEAERAWVKLAAALGQFEHYEPYEPVAREVMRVLLERYGALGQLNMLVLQRDSVGLESWTVQYGSVPDKMLDKAAKAAKLRTTVTDNRRKSLRLKLGKVLTEVARVSGIDHVVTTDTVPSADRLADFGMLQASARRAREQITSPGPESDLARTLLDDFLGATGGNR